MSDTNIHALPIGHTFDGYRILRLLGAGGFGITYLAEETAIGRKVAIKEYLPQGFAARAVDSFSVRAVSTTAQAQFAWGLDRFRKEAATLVAFEHPNIVSVYRYFEANGTAYLVMQYVEGKPLDALISGGATLAESEIEDVVLPILDGLEQVHAAHFLHRDIKPANIYIRRDGRPVLLDFGAARQAFGTESKSITAIVSEGYAPFEQYEAKGDQGPWTDIYAIGAVLYRCITGDRPPAAPERISARLRGTADPMAPAREAGAGRYSARLLEAADRALAVMPSDRPRTIGELRQMLKADDASRVASRALPERATAASAATMTAGPAAAKARSRVPLLAGGAGAIAVAAVAAYFALMPEPPGTAATPSPPPKVSATAPSPAQPSAEDLAERAAAEAVTRAEADLAAVRAILERGDLARAKFSLPYALRQIESALKNRPGHAGLLRVSAEARALDAELAQRVASRVKELSESAEKAAPQDAAEAQRLVAEIERLDPAAAKTARERLDTIARQAQGEKQREEILARHVKLAEYHLDQARGAARDRRLAEARDLAGQARIQLDRAMDIIATDPKANIGGKIVVPRNVADLRRDVDTFQRDLDRRIAEDVRDLIAQARRLIRDGNFDEAVKRLDQAAEFDSKHADLAAVRRELDEAKKKPQQPPDPDAAERERTRGIVRASAYDVRVRRGAAYYEFGERALGAPALPYLQRAVDATRAEANAHLVLACGYDQLEAKDAADGRKLAQERCETAQTEAVRRGVAASRVRLAYAAPGKGPEFRRVAFAVQSDKPAEPPKPPEAAKPSDARPGALQFEGRTARLSRISAERRSVMRIELRFGAGGALAVSCSSEAASGGQSACFNQLSGSGRWSLNGSTLCVSAPVINLPGNSCYEVSGSGNQYRLSGGGLLAGAMLLQ